MLAKVLAHLPYLAAVAKHGSFSKAADEIALTQSALSYQIQKLEDKLGFKVFIRGKGSKIALTSKGELLVNEFNRLEKSFNVLLDDVQIHNKKKHFKISLPTDFGVKVITPLLPTFEKEGITLDLDLNDQVIQLQNSHFDFAIRNNQDEKGVEYLKLLSIENLVICSKQYAQTNNLNAPSDIKNEHKLIVRNKTNSKSWESIFSKNGNIFTHHQNKQLITNSFGMMESTLAGFGIAILPKYFVSDSNIKNRLSILGDVEPTTFYLAYQDSPVTKKWANHIKRILLSDN